MNRFIIDESKIRYTDISSLNGNYTDKMNSEYDWMSKVYNLFLFIFPVWKSWISKVIPYIEGRKILEISFGSGYLMCRYGASGSYDITGIDYNKNMIKLAERKLSARNISATLIEGNVEKLPFADNSFDTLINTMALTGYPDGDKTLSEMKRVLKPGGRLLLVDFDYPSDRNIFGYSIIRFWEKFGDIIKNINLLLTKHNFDFTDIPIGGFGSVHFFQCKKN